MFLSDIIEALNESNSRIYKESVITKLGKLNPIFVRILNRTYSPEYVYGIKKIPEVSHFGKSSIFQIWTTIENLLDQLTNRELTGHSARDAVVSIAKQLSPSESKALLDILKGDLRCGINKASINKVFPGTIPEFPYMRCSLRSGSNIDKFDWTKGVFSQEKADGMFANILSQKDGQYKITSRAGTVFPNSEFKQLLDEFSAGMDWDGYCYHGELLVQELQQATGEWVILSREIGNGVLNSVLKGGSFSDQQKPIFRVWDAVPIESWVSKGRYNIPYYKRYNHISTLNGKNIQPIETKLVFSLKEAFDHYIQMTSSGKEGTVIKNPNGLWRDGTSKDQVKIKLDVEVDLIVRGFNPGNGKNEKWFGSLICESSDGKVQVNVSGFTDTDRERIFNEKDSWIDRKIITVRSNALMKSEDGRPQRLFLPRFIEERLDKSEADSLDKITEIFKNAMIGISD